MSWDSEDTVFQVVINEEEQYSIWPSHKPMPDGWKATGYTDKKADCLAHIDLTWTDMRPLSLRQQMASA
jgi:MbtH protein